MIHYFKLQHPPFLCPIHSLCPLCLPSHILSLSLFPSLSLTTGSFNTFPFIDLTYFEVCWRLKEDKGASQAASEDRQMDDQERWKDARKEKERAVTKEKRERARSGNEVDRKTWVTDIRLHIQRACTLMQSKFPSSWNLVILLVVLVKLQVELEMTETSI